VVAAGPVQRLNTKERPQLKIDFKTLTMMQLRSSPGEVLDRVAGDGEVFVIQRNGQARACLVPVSFLLPDIAPDRISQELSKLTERDEKYTLAINEHNELEITCQAIVAGEQVRITIILPHGYPHSAPRLYAHPVPSKTPHRWQDGSLSIFGAMAIWNPRSHDVIQALALARKWLKQCAKWRKSGQWPAEPEDAL